MHSIRKTALAFAGLAATTVASMVSLVNAVPATADPPPPPVVVAGYANAYLSFGDGFQNVNAADQHTTSGQGVAVRRDGLGTYQVLFRGLGLPNTQFNTPLPGVVHAHGNWGDICQPVTTPLSDGLGNMVVNLTCTNRFGDAQDTPFNVNYTRGGITQGTLNTVRISAAEVATVAAHGGVTPAVQQSSIPNSAIVVTRDPGEPAGIYRISLPRQPGGSRPHALEISPTGGVPSVVCVTSSDKPDNVTGATEEVRVVCRRSSSPVGPVETPLSITYAEDTNTLGLSTESHAYLTPPTFDTTDTVCTVPGPILSVPNTLQRNVFLGVSGGITFQRLCTGHYVIRMDNQGQQLTNSGNVSVNAFSPDRRCGIANDATEPGTTTRYIRFVCGDQYGNVKDGKFQLNYSARQS